MKRATLLTLALLVATGVTYAMYLLTGMTGSSVKGKITDAETNEPVLGATVSAYIGKESKGGVATDLDGNYILNLPASTYRIEINALGYEKKIIENVKVEEGKITSNDIKLSAVSKTLSEVIVIDGAKTKSSSGADGVGVSTPVISYDAVDAPPARDMDAAPSGVTITSSSSYSKSVDATIATGSSLSSGRTASHAYRSTGLKAKGDDYSSSGESGKKASGVIKGKSTRMEIDKKTEDKVIVREPDTKAGQLTAGEWSDNRNWDFFLGIRKKDEWNKMEPNWTFDLSKRYYVKVTADGKPQNDVKVVLKDKKGKVAFEGRSDNNGNCYLFAGLFDKDAANGATIDVATAGGTKTVDAGTAGNIRPVTVDIARTGKVANKLDIMFMIDATGSMGDEINYLKEELSDVVRRVKAESEQTVDIRVSANVYRDKGDEYVVRSFPFTNDMSKVLSDLNAQYAGGGGDFEEAVEEGLDDGINKHDWSEDATARIMFLVLDAPPHNTPDNIAKIQKAVTNAAKKGIRIIPITSSGIDKNTEFLMRFLSIATGGTYVFLTDHSGIGNSHIEPTIGKYDVEYLNNLMVRLIKAYLTTES